MRNLRILGAVCILALAFAGCGGGNNTPFYEKLSELSVDATISYSGAGDPVIDFASASGSVRIGVDAGGTEYRAFLDFPLQGKIPYTANVQSAYLEVFVGSVPYGDNVSVLTELVDFAPPVVATDYFREAPAPYLPPVAAIPVFTFYPSDAVSPRPGVRIDVTSLVQAALQGGQTDFQFRLLLDPNASGPAIVQLDDDTADTAPLLHIDYL